MSRRAGVKITEFCVFFCEPGLLLSTAHELAALKHSLQDAKLSRMSFSAPVAYHQPLRQIIPTNMYQNLSFLNLLILVVPLGQMVPTKVYQNIFV